MRAGINDEALALLRRITGDTAATFRDGQLEAITTLVERRARVLVVQRTGWGKSAVYFIATRLLRDQGAGPTLLISPLLALMRNQIEMAERAGVAAATINSSNRDDWTAVEERVRQGAVDLLLVSPERLNNPRFRQDVLPHIAGSVGMLVVDEAHCISDWGHDFRPDYRRVARVLDLLPRGVPVLCTTATANQRVIDDVIAQLGHEIEVVRGTLDRESLVLDVVVMPSAAERLAWLAQAIPTFDGSGIVYCLTIRDAEMVASWLVAQGIDALAYTGESADDHRLEVERALASNDVKSVVATSALGMGYDKPDVSFVIHYQSPGSPVAYYQQVGRAGRALARSDGILLAGNEDVDIQDYFIRVAFPDEERATAVLELLASAGRPMSTPQLLAAVNVRQTRLEAMLKVLEVEGAVERTEGQGWVRTAQRWQYDRERVERVTAARRAEQAAMFEYIRTDGCLMQHLRQQLDDPMAGPCGRCSRCTGASMVARPERQLVVAASLFLRARPLTIEPRQRWIGARTGTIPAAVRLEPGRALAAYGDGGWGTLVKQAKCGEGRFDDDLLTAAVELIRAWALDPAPEWVTWVPSGADDLVARGAHHIAVALGLPAVEAVRRTRRSKPQKDMENSAQQVGNVYGAFAVNAAIPTGPVLLIDDIVDSRWTLTVVGVALREAGCGAVHPFVFAKAEGS